MESSSNSRGKSGDMDIIELTGKVMLVAIILLFFVLAFFFCLHLCAKWFWYRHQQTTTTTRRRRRLLDFAAGHQEIITVPCSGAGLDPCVLKSIPVVIIDCNEFKDGLECAVCLCKVCDGEKARILPKCNHGFHVPCIDMWFHSQSTCPLCRKPVSDQKQSNLAAESTLGHRIQAPVEESSGGNLYSSEAPGFPTNVLFWGDQTQVSSYAPCMEEDHPGGASLEPSSSSSSVALTSNSPDGTLAIDIPRTINDEEEEEEEEQKSPVPTRFRSLKRLLNGHVKANPSCPRSLDLEHGGGEQS